MPPSDSEPLHRTLRSGARVVIVVQIASQLVTIAVLAVLYRLLGPGPYGLLGLAMPLLLLLRIVITGGLDVAAVQRSELNDRQVSALFWVNQILGLLTAGLTVLLAPALGWFFGVPGLTALTAVLGGTAIAVALGTQHQALLQRRLRLGPLAVIRLAAQACGGAAAVGAALAGWGVWALAVQQYVEMLTLAGLAWAIEPWRPAWTLRRQGTRPLVRFGGYYMLSSLMLYVAGNADKVLLGYALGRYEGPAALGLYTQAFNLMMKPVNVVITPLTGIMLPALSRTLYDRPRYDALLLGFFRVLGLIMFPAGVGLVVIAQEAMPVLGGAQWTAAGPILAALGGSIVGQGFFNALGSVFASAGRPKRLFGAAALSAVAMCGGFLAGLLLGQRAGAPVLGVAAAYTLTLLLLVFPAYLLFCLRSIDFSLRAWLLPLRPAAQAALGMGLVVWAFRALARHFLYPSTAVLLLAEIGVGVAVYAQLARNELRWLLKLGRS